MRSIEESLIDGTTGAAATLTWVGFGGWVTLRWWKTVVLDAWGAGQPTWGASRVGAIGSSPNSTSVRELLRGGRVAACSYSTSICRSCRIYVVFVFNKYMV